MRAPATRHGQVLVGERAPVDLREQALQRRRGPTLVRGDCLGGSPVAQDAGRQLIWGGPRALGQRGVAPVLGASARTSARASLMIFWRRSLPMFEPVDEIGIAEPAFVVGESAATSAPA